MDYNKHDGAVTNVCNSPLFYPYAFVEKIRFALASPCPSCPTPPRVAAPSTPYPATRRRTLHSLPRHKRRGAYLPERLLLSERLLSFAQEDEAQRGAYVPERLLFDRKTSVFRSGGGNPARRPPPGLQGGNGAEGFPTRALPKPTKDDDRLWNLHFSSFVTAPIRLIDLSDSLRIGAFFHTYAPSAGPLSPPLPLHYPGCSKCRPLRTAWPGTSARQPHGSWRQGQLPASAL